MQEAWQPGQYHPGKQGLYDFANEHDACGVGFVANIKGIKSHKIVEDGIEVLRRLLHRGAAGSDPETGDGAGILFQIPDEFFRSADAGLDFELPEAGHYGVAMMFLPPDSKSFEECEEIIIKSIAEENLEYLGRRDVDIDETKLGAVARSTMPAIVQYFIGGRCEMDEDAFERRLYTLRRVIDNKVESQLDVGDAYYANSLSCRTIVYKGLLMAPQVPAFFKDLNNPLTKSALAIVHQRYSTNTFPTWPLAQPFRYLAHNGEINTLRGNINQMRARENSFKCDLFGEDVKKLLPIIQEGQSDSACLDNAVELFYETGRSLPHSMMMLVPQAWGDDYHLGKDLRGFFEYHAGMMEPWDGPAALAFTDGKSIGALLDRNGLRPARYTITEDDFIVLASETGVLEIPPESVRSRGRLGPGQMIYVDIEQERVLFDSEIKNYVARRQPYRRWVEENKITLHGLFDSVVPVKVDKEKLLELQRLYGYTREDLSMILKPMAQKGIEPTGSMGNDAALAVLSERPQLLFNYFKQLFAQVTNPPIDPIREELVMSLTTFIGNKKNILEEKPEHAHLLKLKTPILTNEDLQRLRTSHLKSFQAATIKMAFESGGDGSGLKIGLDEICKQAEDAVREGKSVLVLSDKDLPAGMAPMPSLMAAAAVNHHLIRCGLRTSAGVVIETGEAREIMHFVLLLGYGATAVNPYLAIESVTSMIDEEEGMGIDTTKAIENYCKAVCKGIMKVMSKMGISTLRSYRGAQVFEAVGLNSEMVDEVFQGTASRIEGIGFNDVAREVHERYKAVYEPEADASQLLDLGGNYHYRNNGEKHLWTPMSITKFQHAVRTGDKDSYMQYANYINKQERHLCTLRGLFKFNAPATPIPLEEVEPASDIVKRFVTGAMSYGSISKEAHESIAIAMNRLGGMSNSGEGGEDPQRYIPLENGDSLSSAIKQIASGRFGVTSEYLANARELQIKIAQGAKPGEGGQLPGHKVNSIIAKVRHSTPGVTLISPPPHHDIYSIEDLAQLIYDLKCANPKARISVKLVSEVGVGTVAAGVAKGHSDMVLISGHDGGTGASPMTSIKHAGLPWELGLAETQQTLVLNDLRGRIRVQVDGQMKTGRDVVIGALLGAEEYGFATTVLVSLGCVMMRKCHSNTCPVGVATQDPELRKRFKGKPEHIVNMMMFIAEEVREYLAMLGLRSLDEAIGRTDLLNVNEAIDFWKTKNLDFSNILKNVNDGKRQVRCVETQDHGIDKAYDNKLLEKLADAVDNGEKATIDMKVCNIDRTVGTILSNRVASKYGNAGLPEDTITVNFDGCAGQSFGAFLSHGITFKLTGEANDYVGKGLSGGKIIVKPHASGHFDPAANIIIGNVSLYGATGGKLFVNGMAGERFGIRNSGTKTVVEGVGDHCCEYMTGGIVVVLGDTGVNFAAGMSGGLAYVYDESSQFDRHCNLSMVDLESVVLQEDQEELRSLLEEHYEMTGSVKAKAVIDNWHEEIFKFVKVFPVDYRKALGRMMAEDAAVERSIATN